MTYRTSHRFLVVLSLFLMTFGLVTSVGPYRVFAKQPRSGNKLDSDDTSAQRTESKPWYAAHEDSLLRFIQAHPKLRDLVLKSQGSLPGPVADYVNNKIGLKPIWIDPFFPTAFEGDVTLTRSGRLAVVTLKGVMLKVKRGDRITVVVTLSQTATGAQETTTWHVIGGASRNPRVPLTVTRGGKAFQPGEAMGTATREHRDRTGKLIGEPFTWTRILKLK